MHRNVPGAVIALLAISLFGQADVAVAQMESAQPSRNDPLPAAPNQSSKDTVPPATDDSLPTRSGTQEPSSKITGTDTSTIYVDGVLAVAGARSDLQTAPAKFSERTNSSDQLPIAAYALRHLTDEQRRALTRELREQLALSGQIEGPSDTVVGAEISADVALHGLEPIPAQAVSRLPELREIKFARAGSKMLLVNPSLRRVIAILE